MKIPILKSFPISHAWAWWLSLMAASLLPALLSYAGGASSHAAGVVVASVGTLVLAWATRTPCNWTTSRCAAPVSWLFTSVLILTGIGLHAVIAALWLAPSIGKPLVSLIPAGLAICGAAAMSALAKRESSRTIDVAAAAVFVTLVVSWLFGLARLQPASAFVAHHKPMLPFTEPSHFSLVFTPFALMLCARTSGAARVALQLLCGLIVVGIPNVTAAIGFGIILLLTVPARWLLALALLLAAAWSNLAPADLSQHYAERLNFSATSTNLSVLVYRQGWQLAVQGLVLSEGWGMGFQQLGLHGLVVPAGEQMIAQGIGIRNALDGGFTAAKLLAEFGWLGALLLISYVFLCGRYAWQLRLHALARSSLSPDALLSRSCFVAFGVELFARGAGYFTAGTLLFGMSCWSLAMASDGLRVKRCSAT